MLVQSRARNAIYKIHLPYVLTIKVKLLLLAK
jgi:hypothetical protein